MFCMNGKGSVLRKGIAAFLMLILVGSSLAFTGGTALATEETAGTESEEESSEAVSAVEPQYQETQIEGETSGEAADDDGVVLFAQDEEFEAAAETAAETTAETAAAPINSTYVPQDQSAKLGNTGKLIYEEFHTQKFYVKCNGQTVKAYCVEPTKQLKKQKSYVAKPYNNELMRKALYYSIGYPGYSEKTAGYLAGVSRKSCYKGDNGVYCLCHIVLSYVYDNKNAKSDAFKGVSGSTKTVVKNFLAAIESWPDPPDSADIGLSTSSVKAEWNENAMRQETPEITVTGTTNNTITVPVPEGTSLVKGDSVAASGSVTVAVGESFILTAPATVRTDYYSPKLYGSIQVFQPYLIKTKGSQGQTFGMSSANAVSYNVEWKDFGTFNLKKISSDEEVTTGNSYYSLEGAEYGLYSKASDKSYGDLVTDAEGNAALENIPYGEYYIKEIKASQGYQIDKANHEITIGSQVQSETVLETPEKPEIETSAAEAESGGKSFYVKDDKTGEDASIVDTVTYKNLIPGMEYKIAARLVDKNSGDDIPCLVEEKIFTPDKSSGTLEIEYRIDSSGLGGKAAVAFEKMYHGDSLIAVHEDLNNTAQTVNIMKKPDNAPETGDNAAIMIVLMALSASLLTLILGMCRFFRSRSF